MIPIRCTRRITSTAISLLSVALFSPVAFSIVVFPTAALAAIQEMSSSLIGVSVPRGAARFSGADALFKGVLDSLAREKIVGLSPQSDAVEVLIWQGENYRTDRVAFNKSGLKRALTAAGYTVTEISTDDLRDVNVFAHFDPNDDSLPFRPSVLKHPAFFLATNEAKGRAVLGAWLESDDALAVGFLPVRFKAAPKPAPLPEVTGPNVVLVQDIDDTMKCLPAAKLPAFESGAKKPGTVRGQVKDMGGRPIAGAEVAVYSSAGGGFRTTHKARTNASGMYEVLLPVGIAEVAEAKCPVIYNGATYNLSLMPVGEAIAQFNAKTGHVANFVLKTDGKYGGTLRVSDNVNRGTLEITLTPVGPLLDGSVGRTFVYRYPAEDVRGETFLNGIPLGRYKLTARLLDGGDALPMQVGRTFGSEAERALKDSLSVDFAPGYTFSQVNSGKSNKDVQFFEVTLEP